MSLRDNSDGRVWTLPLGASGGFTLLELLIVITIIAVLATIGLPALKGFGQSNAIYAANRQILDDLARARLYAINNRSTVYVLFASPNLVQYSSSWLQGERPHVTNLINGQYTSYAIFTKRTLGDQPGQEHPRFLTEWQHLPEGVFIDTNKFNPLQAQLPWPKDRWETWTSGAGNSITNRPFAYMQAPFPLSTSRPVLLPYIAFDYRGRLLSKRGDVEVPYRSDDEIIPLTRGSIIYARYGESYDITSPAEVVETPKGNSVKNPDRIQIDYLTGRARAILPQLP